MTTDRKAKEIKYKDERNTKTSDAASLSLSSKKKDKKKWCKGKVGVEHKLECVKYNDVKSFVKSERTENWRLLVCKKCGKELDFYYPISFGSFKFDDNVPDWVNC